MSKVTIHTTALELNWKLISLISDIDRFDASWGAIERREGQSLKELKSIATVRSVGASTRIEGSKLSEFTHQYRTLKLQKFANGNFTSLQLGNIGFNGILADAQIAGDAFDGIALLMKA